MNEAPQLENGYTRLANELLDALIAAGLTARQWVVLMAIIRKTYGFNKKADDIGLSQLSQMTGIAKPHVSVAVRELEARRIITREQGGFGHRLGVNKRFQTWLGVTERVTVTEMVTVTESVTPLEEIHGNAAEAAQNQSLSIEGVTESVTDGGYQNSNGGGYRIGKTGVTELVTTKDNPTKDKEPKDKTSCSSPAMNDRPAHAATHKERRESPRRQAPANGKTMTAELQARFDRWYAGYPRKDGKADAQRAFAKLAPNDDLVDAMVAAVAKAARTAQWQERRYIPMPATWINGQRWLDEITTEYRADELDVIATYNADLGDLCGVIDSNVYVEARAAAIRAFLGMSDKPMFWKRFFLWVRENCDLPPHVGFDWLISAEGFTKVKGGQHARREREVA